MKTKEEMLNSKLCKDYLTDGQWNAIIELMDEYAQQQVKISDVSNARELLISFHQWYHEVPRSETLEKLVNSFLLKKFDNR